MINIVVACDEKYFHKAKELWKSLKDLPYKKQLLCIGFDAQIDGIETARCELKDLKSYRTNFPDNRDFYVCAEGGEFLDYFSYEDNDIIVHIDADMIVQRDFSQSEIAMLNNLKHNEIIGTSYSVPITTMREEFWKLKSKTGYKKASLEYNIDWQSWMFCAGMVICTAKTYKEVIYKHYLSGIDKMIQHFGHHAAGQWLMNYICHKYAFVKIVNISLHTGDWFIDIPTEEKEGKLYYNNELVMFNHTKFNEKYYESK